MKPSTITSGHALSDLLRYGSCPLKKLNLHWNMIRMAGAMALGESIQYTRTLLHLNLSFNSIGRKAANVLGGALLENKSLEELILSNCSIDVVGCFTLIVGIREHKKIKWVDLDGNPIGEQGGRMLMKLAKINGSRVKFSTNRCDFAIKSSDVILKINGKCRLLSYLFVDVI